MIPQVQADKINLLTVQDQDLHGRRVRNASDSELPQDYVTRAELDKKTDTIDVTDMIVMWWRSLKKRLAAYITDPETVAYPGTVVNNAQIFYKDWAGTNQAAFVVVGFGTAGNLALVAELNQLRVAYENIRAAHDDLRTKLVQSGLLTE